MELKIDSSSSNEFEALAEQLAELEDHHLTIVESETALAALEAKIACHRQKSGCTGAARPLPYANVKAFLLGMINQLEAATEKVRFETRAIERANAKRCALIEQKRQTVGNDTIRRHLESFRLETIFGNNDLKVARHTYYELRWLGADVRREILLQKLATYESNRQRDQLAKEVKQWTERVDEVKAKIERTDREIESLELQNEKLRSDLRRHKPPTVQEIAKRLEELRQLQTVMYRTVKRGILDGSIAVPSAGGGRGTARTTTQLADNSVKLN